MRKIIAAGIAAGLMFTPVGAQAGGESQQVRHLKVKVTHLRQDVQYWRDEVRYMDMQLSEAQNRPRDVPAVAFTNLPPANSTLYRAQYTMNGIVWVTAWMYSRDMIGFWAQEAINAGATDVVIENN